MWDAVARRKLRKAIQELAGKRTGYSYAELETILLRQGFRVVSKAGSHRTLKHPKRPQLLTLKDDGKRDVKTVYIKEAWKALKALEEQQ